MELTLAGGVVVDVATRDDVAEHHKRLEKLLDAARPRGQYVPVSGVGAARTAPVVADCGRPPQGRVWMPQWALAQGNDAFTTVSNVTWALFAGPVPSGGGLANGPPVAGINGRPLLTGTNAGIAVPSVQSVPDKSVVFQQENLYAVFAGSGLVAGAVSYTVWVGVIEVEFNDEYLFY